MYMIFSAWLLIPGFFSRWTMSVLFNPFFCSARRDSHVGFLEIITNVSRREARSRETGRISIKPTCVERAAALRIRRCVNGPEKWFIFFSCGLLRAAFGGRTTLRARTHIYTHTYNTFHICDAGISHREDPRLWWCISANTSVKPSNICDVSIAMENRHCEANRCLLHG